MAAYGSVDGVTRMIPHAGPITVETRPNLADVTVWLAGAEAQVNVALAASSDVSPATDADKIAAIGILVNREVAYQVMEIRSGGAKDDDNVSWVRWHKDFTDALDAMRDGTWSGTSDVGAAGTIVMPSSYTMNAPDSPDSSVNPVFTRDQAQNF